MMQPQAKAKHQQFKIDVYDIYNEEILGDRLRINQILINILSNAIKYTPEGGRIDMVVRQMPQHTKNFASFHFVIRDNGIGNIWRRFSSRLPVKAQRKRKRSREQVLGWLLQRTWWI